MRRIRLGAALAAITAIAAASAPGIASADTNSGHTTRFNQALVHELNCMDVINASAGFADSAGKFEAQGNTAAADASFAQAGALEQVAQGLGCARA
jgi:hypothetical protein